MDDSKNTFKSTTLDTYPSWASNVSPSVVVVALPLVCLKPTLTTLRHVATTARSIPLVVRSYGTDRCHRRCQTTSVMHLLTYLLQRLPLLWDFCNISPQPPPNAFKKWTYVHLIYSVYGSLPFQSPALPINSHFTGWQVINLFVAGKVCCQPLFIPFHSVMYLFPLTTLQPTFNIISPYTKKYKHMCHVIYTYTYLYICIYI